MSNGSSFNKTINTFNKILSHSAFIKKSDLSKSLKIGHFIEGKKYCRIKKRFVINFTMLLQNNQKDGS